MPAIAWPVTRSNHPNLQCSRSLALLIARLAAGLLLFLAPVLSARAVTVYVVTTTADGNNGACTVSLCTLRDAVIAANANAGADVITLPAGTYSLTLTGANEDNAATGDLDIKEDLTINGAGSGTTIIDGNATDRVFQVIGAVTLTLNGVTVRNGSTSASTNKSGGGILAPFGATVVLNNSVLTANNGGSGPGGGILAANLTLTNSTVSQNQTSNQGGGIFATNATISGSTISNNQSTGDQGGGLFLINGMSSITNSAITGNTAADDGGGIYLNGSIDVNNPALLTITNSTISSNTAPDGGAMFLLSFATVTITESTINGNTATAAGGGGILDGGARLNIANCTIVGNTISGGTVGGGGILNNGGIVTIVSSTIDSNTAPPVTGGGIGNAGSVTLTNTIVSKNTGDNCVGTITNGGTNLQFPGTTCGAAITLADPLLQALASNGGPTQTQALGAGSPAIDQGTTGCPPFPATDQRGVTRPQGAGCEIGALECQTGECGGTVSTPTPTSTPVGVATATPTPTPITGVVVPTLSFSMLVLLALALVGAALFLLKR